jgi:hypothetical protein
MRRRKAFPYLWPLAGVALANLAVMAAFEGLKQVFHAGIGLWESHLVTILFTTLLAVLASAFALSRQDRLRRVLGGLLPICASCKRIRDANEQWLPVEHYIREHSEAEFSHGICPDCARRLYPEMS